MRKLGYLVILAATALSLHWGCSNGKKGETDLLLRRLDETLAMKKTYEGYFFQRIETIRGLSSGSATNYEINKSIANEFSSYSLDSTIFYLERCRSIAAARNDNLHVAESDFLLAREYGRAGYHSEAMDIIDSYIGKDIPEELTYQFYEVLNYLYGELAAYSPQGGYSYWVKRDETRMSLLEITGEGTYDYYDQLRVQAESQQDEESALKYAMDAMNISSPNSKQYARAAFFVAMYQKDEDSKLHYLILSAIADVVCANKDYASLSEIAKILYDRGDVEKAFKYVADHCMPDALVFNGKLRPWQTAQIFPAIEKAYDLKSEKNSRRLIGISSVLLLLTFALIALLWFLYKRHGVLVRTRKELESSKEAIERQNEELQEVNHKLSGVNSELHEANMVRQEYITLFLQTLSENISTSRSYKNHVLKYIRRGNEKYIAEEIESDPPIEDDIRSFNKMFDETFINLFPNFVEKFNALLQEPEVPKGDDILTPELRVFALVKLGISDSSKIASLLHYSANTIYNYRAKIKNKTAIDRDRFEEAVRAIE